MSPHAYEVIGRYATYASFTLTACVMIVLICTAASWALDRVIRTMKLHKEVMEFFWERARKRRKKSDAGSAACEEAQEEGPVKSKLHVGMYVRITDAAWERFCTEEFGEPHKNPGVQLITDMPSNPPYQELVMLSFPFHWWREDDLIPVPTREG